MTSQPRSPHDPRHPSSDTGTDAPLANGNDDADALDAWLEGMPWNLGAPNPRSERHDVRSDLRPGIAVGGETSSLTATATAFHRRIGAAQARDARAAEPDPGLWEQIMDSTAKLDRSTTRTHHRATPPQRKVRSRHVRPTAPHSTRPVPTRRATMWNAFSGIGLAIVLLAASFGVWRAAGDGGGPTDPPAGVRSVVMQPDSSTPVASLAPVATPRASSACDVSSDIPIIPGADASPIDGTALLVTPSGDLVLTCAEEPEGITLASGVESVVPLRWPGTMRIDSTTDNPDEWRSTIVNVQTGATLDLGVTSGTLSVDFQQMTDSPWHVAANPDDPSDAILIDLRTLETRSLASLGYVLRENDGLVLTSNGAAGQLAIALRGESASQAGPIVNRMLIVDGSLGAIHIVTLDVSPDWISRISMAPDGRHLAVTTTLIETNSKGQRLAGESHTHTIHRTEDGIEVARSDTFDAISSGTAWVQGGDALVYTQPTDLMLLSVESGAGPTALLESDQLLHLRGTAVDGDTVLVFRQPTNDVSTAVEDGEEFHLYAINTRTGEVTTVMGVDVSHNEDPPTLPTRFLVMEQPNATPVEPNAYTVVDAVSGETVGEITDVPPSDTWATGVMYPYLDRWPAVSTPDGETEVIVFNAENIWLMQGVEESAGVLALPAIPDGVDGELSSVILSPDGSMLSLAVDGDESRAAWLLDLDDPAAAWVESPATTPGPGPRLVPFVTGTGD